VGGIIIPDNAKEKPMEGQIVAIGHGRRLEDGSLAKLDVKVGEKVLFSKYSGTEIKVKNEEHLVMKEDDLLGVIEG